VAARRLTELGRNVEEAVMSAATLIIFAIAVAMVVWIALGVLGHKR
jgi:hypothetical protein